MSRGIPRSIETENEQYVLRALSEAKDGAGVKEIALRAGRFLKADGKRRRFPEDLAQKVLRSLEFQGKAAPRRTTPVTWQITFEGKKYL